MRNFYAHSGKNPDHSDWQPLQAHLEAVADIAHRNAQKFEAGDWGRVIGLLHDLGKYSHDFQAERLREPPGRRVDHSTMGAKVVSKEVQCGLLRKLLAFCIAGHHAGLANGVNGEVVTALEDRLTNCDIPELDPAWRDEIPIPKALTTPEFRLHDQERAGFQLAHFTRMLFSCLVDADRKDTAAYYDGLAEYHPKREIVPLRELRDQLDRSLVKLTASAEAEPDPGQRMVNAKRAEILSYVRAQADETRKLFSLTVPTGGGKTLTSLAFALDHAIQNDLDRVIYVIPFTSIIEQTAAVFRKSLGKFEDAVLEHHSAFDWGEAVHRTSNADIWDGARELRLAMESWDKPIVVTTALQFFESLFSNRPSKCRKLHNIAKSVVILDEAQKLPLPLLRPCVAMLDELARNYKTSIVLCTATQPAIRQDRALPNGGFEGGLQDVKELAPNPTALYRAFKRVTVEEAGTLDDAALTEQLLSAPQILCIVNSRAHARALYGLIEDADGARHLTTLMCAKHRSKVLKEIKQDLADEKPCRLIATSLMEAGVDIDFPTVYRAVAGIDSITQAAGRCNREGKRKPEDSRVVVFEAADWKARPELSQFASIGRSVAQRYEEDMLSLEAVDTYFRDLYWLKEQGSYSELDKHGILKSCHTRAATLDFDFETIARQFRMIEDGMAPVIIPFDEPAKDALRTLEYADKIGNIARRLQPYIVPIPPKARAALIASDAAVVIRPDEFGEQFVRLVSLDPEIYNYSLGLRLSDNLLPNVDGLII